MNVSVENNLELWRSVFFTVCQSSIGVIPRHTRGLTLGFDGEVVYVRLVVDKDLTEEEAEAFYDMEVEVIATHIYKSNFDVVVINTFQSSVSERLNWGWVYLTRE